MQNDEKKKKAIINRIAKIIGHTKYVKSMVERGEDCSEVLIQLSAVKAAISNTGKVILKDYMVESIERVIENKNEEELEKLSRNIDSFMK